MIVVRSPLRVSFFGGGSDLPAFYRKHGGAVLSTAINKFVYIVVNPTPNQGLKLIYSKIEQASDVTTVEHPLIRETLKMFGATTGLEIGSFADLPTRGTGLGSSSTFTVGLVCAMAELSGRVMSRYEIAEAACEIEIDRCHEPIGKQDQYAAAFGGLNMIRFQTNDRAEVAPVNVSSKVLGDLQGRLLMFFTGRHRSASDILREQGAGVALDAKKTQTTQLMAQMAQRGYQTLIDGDLDAFGALLHEAWTHKKSLAAGITDPAIDDMYERALKAGALGGKILGAGGGGFLLLYVDPARQESVRAAMRGLNHNEFEFAFFDQPCQAVYSPSAGLWRSS